MYDSILARLHVKVLGKYSVFSLLQYLIPPPLAVFSSLPPTFLLKERDLFLEGYS